MTSTNDDDRLSRVERILERLAERQDRFQDQLEFGYRLSLSNARAIQALGSTVEDDRAEHDQVDSELRVDVNDNSQRIQVLIGESRENIREHRAFRERFDRMLDEIQRIWQRLE